MHRTMQSGLTFASALRRCGSTTSASACRPLVAASRSMMMHAEHTAVKYADAYHDHPPAITTLTPAEELQQDQIRNFAESFLRPRVSSMESSDEAFMDVLGECFAQGLMGIEIPSEFGGSAMSFFSNMMMIEELSKVHPSLSTLVDVQNNTINNTLLRWGTSAQKSEWLPRLANDTLGTFCVSDRELKTTLKTTAVPVGDEFVINGKKSNVMMTSAESNLFIVFANASPELGYKGITAFLVDSRLPGITIKQNAHTFPGLRSLHSCDIYFDNVSVHNSCVLGVIGKGYRIGIECMDESRMGAAAQLLGTAQGAFNKLMPQLMDSDCPSTKYMEVQHQSARAACSIATARLMLLNATRLKEDGMSFVHESNMAKIVASTSGDAVFSMYEHLPKPDSHLDMLRRDFVTIQTIHDSNDELGSIARHVIRDYDHFY